MDGEQCRELKTINVVYISLSEYSVVIECHPYANIRDLNIRDLTRVSPATELRTERLLELSLSIGAWPSDRN